MLWLVSDHSFLTRLEGLWRLGLGERDWGLLQCRVRGNESVDGCSGSTAWDADYRLREKESRREANGSNSSLILLMLARESELSQGLAS